MIDADFILLRGCGTQEDSLRSRGALNRIRGGGMTAWLREVDEGQVQGMHLVLGSTH